MMKSYNQYLVCIALSLTSLGLHAMHQYNLSPENILRYAPVMPQEAAFLADAWTNKHEKLLQALACPTDQLKTNHEDLKAMIEVNKKLIEQEGLQNLGHHSSYVFKVPMGQKDYFFKLARPVNKVVNVIHGNEFNWGWDWNNVTHNLPTMDTFQTVSTLVGYKLLSDAKAKYGVTAFVVPPTYLVQVPGRSPIANKATDENSIIMQESIGDDYVIIRDNFKLLEGVSEKTIVNALPVIKQVPCWDINGNGMIDSKNFTFGLADLEHPNNNKPYRGFFNMFCPAERDTTVNNNTWWREYYELCSLEGFIALLKDAHAKGCDVKEQSRALKNALENDPQLQQSQQWAAIQERMKMLNPALQD